MDVNGKTLAQEKVDQVRDWQSARPGAVHPLTCLNSSKHDLLEPVEVDSEEIKLVCPTCGWEQPEHTIPEMVFNSDFLAYRSKFLRELEGKCRRG